MCVCVLVLKNRLLSMVFLSMCEILWCCVIGCMMLVMWNSVLIEFCENWLIEINCGLFLNRNCFVSFCLFMFCV